MYTIKIPRGGGEEALSEYNNLHHFPSNDVENVAFVLKLEREKAQHAAEMNGLEKQIAQLKDQLNEARHGLQDQVGLIIIIIITCIDVSNLK